MNDICRTTHTSTTAAAHTTTANASRRDTCRGVAKRARSTGATLTTAADDRPRPIGRCAVIDNRLDGRCRPRSCPHPERMDIFTSILLWFGTLVGVVGALVLLAGRVAAAALDADSIEDPA